MSGYGRWLACMMALAAAGPFEAGALQVPASTPPAPPPQPATQPSTAPAQDLPPADELIEAALEAMGGRDALNSIESTSIKVTDSSLMFDAQVTFTLGKAGEFLIQRSNPDITVGCNGEVGWMARSGAYELLQTEQIDSVRTQSDFVGLGLATNFKRNFNSFQTVDRTKLGEQDVYKVRLIDAQQTPQFAFFGVESKFIEGLEITSPGPMGAVTRTFIYDDWKEHGDIKLFNKIAVKQGEIELSVMTFTGLELNKVDPVVFDLPEEVKELVRKKEKESPPLLPPATEPETQPATAPASTQPQTQPGRRHVPEPDPI